MSVSRSQFIEKTMMLDGHPWGFEGRGYVAPIINEDPTWLLLKTGRQCEKSTTVAGRHIATMCTKPNYSSLYVSPTMTQTSVYSKKKIDVVFETSRLLRNTLYPGARGFSVTEKRLKNNHTAYFRSAHRDADTIRGISSDATYIDEIQDIVPDCIPVIEECSSHKPHALFAYTGTPKSMGNPIEELWQKSSMCEWTIKCQGCNHWNILSLDLIQLDNPGIFCTKCGKELEVESGLWVSYNTNPLNKITGYCFPQIILPRQYINWENLFHKIRVYPKSSLMNEVFGQSFDSGVKPITESEIVSCCDSSRDSVEISDLAFTHKFFAGVDWGSGTTSYTILHVGYWDAAREKMVITFAKKYFGKEADPEFMIPDIVRIIKGNNARFVGLDFGFGFVGNQRVAALLGKDYHAGQYCHTNSKQFVSYNAKTATLSLGRTLAMSETFHALKKRDIEFFSYEQYKDFARDILNIESEYNERTGQMRYVHLISRPDDSFHSLLYMYVTMLIHLKKKMIGKYSAEDESDEG